MLYRAGIVILKKVSNAPLIPYLTFPSSRIQFAGSLYQVQKKGTEETGLIEVAECVILLEEFIKTRKILVTSNINPTNGTNPSPEEGASWCLLHGLNDLPRRW
jgi:hypothetical protein